MPVTAGAPPGWLGDEVSRKAGCGSCARSLIDLRFAVDNNPALKIGLNAVLPSAKVKIIPIRGYYAFSLFKQKSCQMLLRDILQLLHLLEPYL